MNDCTFSRQIAAYHDGELDPLQRDQVQRHVAQCDQCATALRQMQLLSSRFAQTQTPRLSQISLQRVHRRVEAVMDERLVWTARVLSGIAAAVLIVGSISLLHMSGAPRSTTAVVSTTPPWAGITASTDAEMTTIAANTPAAQWYLTENSSRAEELP